MSSPRRIDYLGHMLTAAREALGFVEGSTERHLWRTGARNKP
jgi:hypothetical protein